MDGVVVNQLSVINDGRVIVPELTFSLIKGELVGLVGPNGVGKTTAIRALIGLEQRYGGAITVAGSPIELLSPRERASWFAYIPQTRIAQGTGMSVRQVVETGRVRFLGRYERVGPRDRVVIERAMAMAGIEHFGDRLFDELSGGEQQRVLIASALAQEAHYLILDEPTTFLDICAAHDVMNLLRRLAADAGVGALVVCHDISLILSYACRIIALASGGVAFCGSANELMGSSALADLYTQPLRVIPDPEDRYPCLVPQQ